MKFTSLAVLGALLAALSVVAVAADRETLSLGGSAPDAKKIEGFLFPEAQCENVKYQCLSVRPSTERSVGMDVRFQTGSAELGPEAKAQLQTLGKVLAARKGKLNPGEIVIEGHTDARGSDELNKRLSQERARSVVQYLVASSGVDAAVLKPVGLGKEHLKDPSRPDAMVNRRVELVRKPK